MTLHRALTLAPVDPAARSSVGLLVPWDAPSLVTDDGHTFYREVHQRGSILVAPDQSIPVYDGHTPDGQRGPHIGDVTDLTDRPDGLYGRFRMRAGLDPAAPGVGLSIEFDALETVTQPDGTQVRVRSQLVGLAITDAPAYGTARVHSSRSTTTTTTTGEPPTMDPTNDQTNTSTPSQGDPEPSPQGDAETHRRSAAAQTMSGTAPVAPAASTQAQAVRPRFRSIGDFMSAVANRRIDAEDRDRYFRALTTATTADDAFTTRENWVTEIVDYIGRSQPFIAAFSQLPLPETGMTVTYPRVTQRPVTGKQAAQLDEVSSGKAVITKTPANIETYAGGARVSLQEVQRSDPSYLTMLFELHAEEMAMDMDQGAIAAVAAVVPVGNKITLSAAAPTAINGKIVAGIKKILSARVPYDPVMVLGLDVWENWAGAVDSTGRPLFPHINGFNPVGTISLTDPTNGDVRSLPYSVDPNMTATKAYLGWRRAYTSQMGALQTLSADAVANLGRDEVVFQYCAHLVRRPDALVEYTLGV